LGSKGVQSSHNLNLKMYKSDDEAYVNLFGRIPREFDARKEWKRCTTIGQVRDQGNCGSCWVRLSDAEFKSKLKQYILCCACNFIRHLPRVQRFPTGCV